MSYDVYDLEGRPAVQFAHGSVIAGAPTSIRQVQEELSSSLLFPKDLREIVALIRALDKATENISIYPQRVPLFNEYGDPVGYLIDSIGSAYNYVTAPSENKKHAPDIYADGLEAIALLLEALDAGDADGCYPVLLDGVLAGYAWPELSDRYNFAGVLPR